MEKRENQRIMLSKRLIKESLTRLLASESIHKISVRMRRVSTAPPFINITAVNTTY